MAKKKSEKITEIVNYDKDGNIVTQKLTGNTGGYTRETTPALVGATQNNTVKGVEPTVKTARENSAVKKYGFNLSNAITDLANMNEAIQNERESIPIIGKFFKANNTLKKTALNAATNMGEGALKTGEGVLDTLNDWADAINNPLTYTGNKAVYGKEKADKILKEDKNKQEEFIKKNLVQELENKTGYNDVRNDLEKDSLIKQENVGGQIAQGIGGMVPSLLAGQYLGFTPEMTSTKGLTGLTKAKAVAGNLAKSYASQLPSNTILGASSYGSGVEEALNEGATREQARKYGLANTAIEQGTEYLTGGIPGLGGKGGLDDVIEPLIDKNSRGYANALLKAGYGAFGEGLEESTGTYLDALAKKGILGKDINWKDVNKEALQSGLVGAATGAILNSPSSIQDIQNARNEIRNQQAQRVQETPAQPSITQNNINTQEQVETTPTRQENEQINTQQVQTRVEPQTVETKPVAKLTQQEQQELNILKDLPFELDEQQERRMDELLLKQNKDLEKNMSPVRDLSDVRDFSEVGSKKVNAYQYDNPEVKPYFQEVAKDMLYDLGNSTKGERYMTEDGQFKGIKRNVPNDIAELLDGENGVKYSYKEIEDGLNAIIKDNGAENKAVAKRLEFYIDQRLRNGYMDSIAGKIPANNEYIETLRNKNTGEGNPINTQNITNQQIDNKQKQLEIINQSNPMQDEYHTGIRNKNDIKTFDEAIQDDESFVWGDYSKEDAERDLQKGTVTVYSSKPIEQGAFVSTSQNQARDYAGGGKIYSQEVPINDVAWINGDEGQYAKVENPNIPAEMEKEEVLKFTAKDINGKDVKLNKNNDVYEKEIPKPKDNKSIIPKETLEKQLLKLNDGTKISNFYTNITDSSKFITENNAQKLSQEEIWKYAPQTNKETMKNAMAEIGETQQSVDNAYADFLSKTENFTPEDVAKGWIFLKRFQDAGNYDAMVQVAKKMRNIGTKSGQTVQMFNLQSRLTPEGMVKYAQSELMEAEQAYNKGKTKEQIEKHAKDFELTGDEVEYIKNQMEKIQNMEDGREKNIEMAKINKMLSDKLPHQKGDSIKAWMRISMLFNPKTQVRNIAGNALITPVNALSDIPAAIVDKVISRKTNTRTIGAPSLGGLVTYGKGFAKGGKEAIQDYRMGINTKDVDMSRFDITQGKPFVETHEGLSSILNPFSKVGNKANDILDLVMSGGDRVFYQGAFESSLKNQMKLNNVDAPTQDMIDIATQEALSRTWNDNNGYTNFVLNTRRALNKLNVGNYGLGDVLIPFAKTPANLTKAIVDYSPVGLANSIFKTKGIKNAIETGQITPQMQHEFAQNVGKGVAGTMLYVLAYALAKNGIASGSKDDDKDVANFMKNTMGIQPYSIKIGDKSFTYDWAQPIAAPLAIVTDAYKNLSGKSDEDTTTRIFNTVLDVSNTGLNVLMEQSFLSGISEVLNNNEGAVNGIMEQIMGLPSRAIPTLFKQVNDMIDTTQRTTYENNKPVTTAKQNVMVKTPYSKELAPSVDTLGREIKKYGGDKNKTTYAIKVFLSPANESNARTTKTAKEIYALYEATGDKTIMPRVAPYYVQTKETGRIDLSSKDRAKYQKTSGKIVNEALGDLMDNNEYKNLSDDKKAQVVSKIVGYADAKAKEDFTGKISSYYSGADKKINSGMGIADYYLDRIK